MTPTTGRKQRRDIKTDTEAIIAQNVSILAETVEIERHFHSGERWFGIAAVASGETHIADRIGAGAAGAEAAPLVVDAGNDDWGAWTQILGSADTPTDGGAATHYDLHRIIVEAADNTAQRYMVQIALQENAPDDDPGAADTYTEFELVSAGVGALATVPPFSIQGDRAPATTKAWARTRAPNQNTSELGFYIGIHEYFA